jgi:dimethylhistidine N-methyltransferase
MSTRHSVAPPTAAAAADDFASAVQYYLALQPRQLPSRYFYDALGSALFEAICELPWYQITRAELRLLDGHAREILDLAAPLSRLVELGPGKGAKLAKLLAAANSSDRTPSAGRLAVHLVDLSEAALAAASRQLSVFDAVDVVAHARSYESGLAEATSEPASDRTLVLFLGSNIGNFDPPGAAAFLRSIRAALRPVDQLLVGADLVKPEADLLRAYDDPLGVTAAFNRNLLVRINRELDGNFDVGAFGHRAVWNPEQSRVEMHLVCRRTQDVRIRRAGMSVRFAEGETIWTESSYKYAPEGVVMMLEEAGFRLLQQWIDVDAAFALTLVEAA